MTTRVYTVIVQTKGRKQIKRIDSIWADYTQANLRLRSMFLEADEVSHVVDHTLQTMTHVTVEDGWSGSCPTCHTTVERRAL